MTPKTPRKEPTKRPPSTTRPAVPPPVDDAPRPSTPARSEGQRLLLGVKASLAEIARAAGCSSKQTVANWRTGEKVPGPANRDGLRKAFGIPLDAWDRPPAGAAALPRPPALPGTVAGLAASIAALPTTREGARELLAFVKQRRGIEGLPSAEYVQLAGKERDALALCHTIEQAEALTEDRVVREHPRWRAMRGAILKALTPWPDALAAVAAALEALGDG